MTTVIAVLLLFLPVYAQGTFTGDWAGDHGSKLVLIERDDGLDIDGHRYFFNRPDRGVHPGSSDRFQSRLTRTPRGYQVQTQTITADQAPDGFIRTHLLEQKATYELEGQTLVLTVDSDSDRERFRTMLRYHRVTK